MDVKGKLTAPSRKMAVFLDAEVGKKETPSKGCLFLLDTLAAGTTLS